MDNKLKNCPSCTRPYRINPTDSGLPPNVPLLFDCGHSMCETCVKNIDIFEDPIECKVCYQNMQVSPIELDMLKHHKIPIQAIFPVNLHLLGELSAPITKDENPNQNDTDNACFLDIKELIESADADVGIKQKNNCIYHPNKELIYYCKDCSKPICRNCLLVRGRVTCKDHCIIPLQDMNETFYAELQAIVPKVDEMFHRLTQTALDIGNLLKELHDPNNTYTTLMDKVNQHFSKLNYILHKQKFNITLRVQNMKTVEIAFLKEAKNAVAKNIKLARLISNSVLGLRQNVVQELSLITLLQHAKIVANTPWSLKELDQNIEVIINEDLYASAPDSIQLTVNPDIEFTLYDTEELLQANEDIPEPPASIVYPTELVKDNNRAVVGPVAIIPETEQPEYLVAGWREIIYVSHIVDPNNFYVQRESERALLQDMTDEFAEAAFYDQPTEEQVTKGKIQLIYNEVDNSWQRCRIININKRDETTIIFHAFCIDFGTSYAVNIDNLRQIPLARIHSPPPFAINCSLAQCRPIEGSWTRDDSLLMQYIVDNKQAVIYTDHVSYLSDGRIRLECDIVTAEDGVSVMQALAFQKRARIPESIDLTFPKRIAFWGEQPQFKDSNYYFQPNLNMVLITHICCPRHFYVRNERLQFAYEKLCEDLAAEYNSSTQSDYIYLPKISMACVANIQELELGTKWARAVVVELSENKSVLVKLTDIGPTALLHWSALRRIRKKFTVQLEYAYQCHLAGLTPLDRQWSPEATALLESFRHEDLEMYVENNSNSYSLGITLYAIDFNRKVCVNEQMIKNKFATSRVNSNELQENVCAELVLKGKMPLESPVLRHLSKEVQTKFKQARHQVKILDCQSPSIIYISWQYKQKIYEIFNDTVQNCYSEPTEDVKTDWQVGDRCCTISNRLQTWNRAVILELENENAKVFYSDFAFTETVPILSLREMDRKISLLGNAAVMCHLHGVKPATGEEWPSLTKEYLKELLGTYNKAVLNIVGTLRGQSLPVELWVSNTIEGDENESNSVEWLSLNKKIIERGLGVPDE